MKSLSKYGPAEERIPATFFKVCLRPNFVQSPCVRRNPEDLLHWRFPEVLFTAYRGSDSLCLFQMVMCVGLQSGVATRNCIRSPNKPIVGEYGDIHDSTFPCCDAFHPRGSFINY